MGLKDVLNFKHTIKNFLKQCNLTVLKLLSELKATLLQCCRNSDICAWNYILHLLALLHDPQLKIVFMDHGMSTSF